MRIEGRVGVARYNDDAEYPPRIGSQGELIISDFNGKYYEQTMRGNAFVYTSTAAAAIAALGNNNPTLWNPMGSGKNLVITKVVLGAAAVGTPVMTAFQWGYQTGVGSQVGTAAPVVSLTAVAGVNLLLGAGNNSIMRYAPATITLTTAPTFLAPIGFSLSATVSSGWNLTQDVDGGIIVPPGTLVQIGASTATSTTFFTAIYGLELPIPSTA